MLYVSIFLDVILLSTIVSTFPTKLLLESPSSTLTPFNASAFDNHEDKSQSIHDSMNNSEVINNISEIHNSTLSIEDDEQSNSASVHNITMSLFDTNQFDHPTGLDGDESELGLMIVFHVIPTSINANGILHGKMFKSDEIKLNSTLYQDLMGSLSTLETADVSIFNNGENKPKPPVAGAKSLEMFNFEEVTEIVKLVDEENRSKPPLAEALIPEMSNSRDDAGTVKVVNEENEPEPPVAKAIFVEMSDSRVAAGTVKVVNDENAPKPPVAEAMSSEMSNFGAMPETIEVVDEENEPNKLFVNGSRQII